MENPYGYIEEGKIYLKGFLHFPDREIGVVKENPEATINYFTDRFEILSRKITKLEDDIKAAENKGSYLMKLLHLKKLIGEFDALGDYVPLFKKLNELEEQIKAIIAENRIKNLEIKTALLKETEEALKIENLADATKVVLDIKDRWLKTGPLEKDKNEEYENQLRDYLNQFFEKKKQHYLQKKQEVEEKSQKYREALAKIKSLVDEKKFDQEGAEIVKTIQKEWRTYPRIPFKNLKEFNNTQRRLAGDFFRGLKFQQRRQQQGASLQENLKSKQSLFEQAEFLKNTMPEGAGEEIQELQEKWNSIGNIPKEHYKELTEGFFTACEIVHERLFLEKLAISRQAVVDDISKSEKIRTKINLLRDFIRRDEKELDGYKQAMFRQKDDRNFDKELKEKFLNQRRKVIVKKMLLKEFYDSLNALKS